MRPWVVLASGAGEAALAADVAAAAIAAGRTVLGLAGYGPAQRILEEVGVLVRSAPDSAGLDRFLVENKAEVLILANSLTCAAWLSALAWRGPVVSLECSWMPWAALDRRVQRIDRCIVLLPESVFEAGMGANGGAYDLAPSLRSRTLAVGWAPAPAAPRGDRRTVAIYRGQPPSQGMFAAFGPALELVARRHPELAWRQIDDVLEPRLPNFVEAKTRWLDRGEFRAAVQSARLVISHHGIGTIGLAMAARVPVLAFTTGGSLAPRQVDSGWADAEMHAASRAATILPCFVCAPAEAIARRVDALLDADFLPQQCGGADGAVGEIARFVGE